MEDEACSLLEQVAQEARLEEGKVCLSKEQVQKLWEVFGDQGGQVYHDGSLWKELSARRVSLGDVVSGLVGTMEKAGVRGVQAAHVYLGLLLSPECPCYSIFSPLALQVLLHCVLVSCKPGAEASTSNEMKSSAKQRGKKARKKGKRVRCEENDVEEVEEAGGLEVDLNQVANIVSRLHDMLQVISLKEHQGALKSLLDFLVELPHVVAEQQQESASEERSQKSRKVAASKNPESSNLIQRLTLVLQDLLESAHGEEAATAVLILKLLTPSLLLMRSGGGHQQKMQIRTSSLEFIVKSMLGRDEKFHTAVAALTRYLCFKAPEKTDARMQAVEAIVFLVKALGSLEQQDFGKFVSKLSRSKSRYRLLALDLCSALFSHLRNPLGLEVDAGDADSQTSSSWGILCIEAVLQRCSDKVPTIRARALTTLAHIIDLLSQQVRERKYLQTILAALGSTGETSNPDEKTSWNTPFDAMGKQNIFTVSGARVHTPAVLSPGAHKGDLGSLLRKRCSDDKVAVRKAALTLLTKSTVLMGKSPDEQTLKAIGFACSDPMLSIRKGALATLSEVTRRFCSCEMVASEWLRSALPLVMDNESSVQEEAAGLFKELVLDPIASVSLLKISNRQLASALLQKVAEPEQLLPSGMMHFLAGIAEDSETAQFIKRVCIRLGKSKSLRASAIMALEKIITSSEELGRKARFSDNQKVGKVIQGAWFLLSELSCFLPKVVGWDFLRTHWQLLGEQGPVVDEQRTPVPFSSCSKKHYQETAAWAASRVYLLQTISNVAVELPPNAAADLADELLKRLEDFSMHPSEVGAHVNALTTLCKQKAATDEEGEELVAEWARQLLQKAETILKAYLSGKQDSVFQTPRPKKSSARRRRQDLLGSTPDTTEAVTAVFTVGAVVLVCPDSKTGNISSLLQDLISEKATFSDPALNAQTWVALGKLCLADDKLAKRLIPVFLQELEATQSAAIRNNIMVTLTDFCVRYTALIESYIPKLTKALRDSCEIVRRQTFVLLARLLQRDYVKWRGMIFHRFLLALVDESPKICQMAEFLFGSILKTKSPLLAYNSFVEAIFVLNDYQGHSSGSTVLQSSDSERNLFSLRGSNHGIAAQRMHIYTTLLKQMSPEHLLATSAKLYAEVLAGVLDGMIDISVTSGKCVVEDALKILGLKELRLSGNKVSGCAELAEEDDGSAAFAAAKGKVVSQLAKRNLIQNAIPIFTELKRLLEKRSSSLIGNLMECLRIMLKDYKTEIEEILVADKQLLKELMYDMQKHENAKARSRVEAATSNAVRPEPQNEQNRAEVEGIGDKENRRPPAAGKTAMKKKGAETTRVTWRDQTPQLRGLSAAIVSPVGRTSTSENVLLSPRSLLGAAGDMAAAATAATVLQEAAAGKSTPLRTMSLPRLRPGTASAQHVRREVCEELASVRRRLDEPAFQN